MMSMNKGFSEAPLTKKPSISGCAANFFTVSSIHRASIDYSGGSSNFGTSIVMKPLPQFMVDLRDLSH